MDALVLVSGWSGPGFEWLGSPIRNEAYYWGLKPICFRQCNNGWGDIHHNARKLARLTDSLHESGQFNRIYTVGHSMGGLVCAEALSWTDRPSINKLVSIGTPHKGVAGAKFAFFSTSARQMDSASEYLKDLATTQLVKEKFFAIGCRFDEIVRTKNSFPDYATKRKVYNHGHLSIIYSKKVARDIHSWLTEK